MIGPTNRKNWLTIGDWCAASSVAARTLHHVLHDELVKIEW